MAAGDLAVGGIVAVGVIEGSVVLETEGLAADLGQSVRDCHHRAGRAVGDGGIARFEVRVGRGRVDRERTGTGRG